MAILEGIIKVNKLDSLLKNSKLATPVSPRGFLLHFPVADGYAYYVVTQRHPLTIKHVDYLDGYQVHPALIRGLEFQDVLSQMSTRIFFSK